MLTREQAEAKERLRAAMKPPIDCDPLSRQVGCALGHDLRNGATPARVIESFFSCVQQSIFGIKKEMCFQRLDDGCSFIRSHYPSCQFCVVVAGRGWLSIGLTVDKPIQDELSAMHKKMIQIPILPEYGLLAELGGLGGDRDHLLM